MQPELSKWQIVDKIMFALFALGCLVILLALAMPRPSGDAGVYFLLCFTNLNLFRFHMQWCKREMHKEAPIAENEAGS